MRVRSKFFQSSTQSWDTMFREAAEFASKLGASDRLINISHSCDGGVGVVCVWYASPDENNEEESAF